MANLSTSTKPRKLTPVFGSNATRKNDIASWKILFSQSDETKYQMAKQYPITIKKSKRN